MSHPRRKPAPPPLLRSPDQYEVEAHWPGADSPSIWSKWGGSELARAEYSAQRAIAEGATAARVIRVRREVVSETEAGDQ